MKFTQISALEFLHDCHLIKCCYDSGNVFPGQEGCKPDELILRTTSIEQPDEEGATPGTAKKVEILHIWNGKIWVAQAPVETQLPSPVRESASSGDSEGD